MKLALVEHEGRRCVASEIDHYRAALFAEDDWGYSSPVRILQSRLDGYGTFDTVFDHAPVVEIAELDFLPPLEKSARIFCIGLNYPAHGSEAGHAPPEHPMVFARYASSIVGHDDALVAPEASDQFDFEGELAIVVGRPGRRIEAKDALRHIAGFSIFNDGSVRDFQLRSSQWMMGKNFDRSGAFGPWIVSPEVLPPGASGLMLETRLNGVAMQRADTAEMLFSAEMLIASLSETLTLLPGDVIMTGTPAGVGALRTPPVWMRPGDRIEVEIEGIGVLANTVAAEKPDHDMPREKGREQ